MKQTMTSNFRHLRTSTKASSDLIQYRLYRVRSLDGSEAFQIQCTFRDENLTCTLNTHDAVLAQEIYARIVRGKVTPCSLRDVLEELCP